MSRAVTCDACGKIVGQARNARAAEAAARRVGGRLQPGKDSCRACLTAPASAVSPPVGQRWRHVASRTIRTVIAPPGTGNWHPGDVRSRGRDGRTYVHTAAGFLAAHKVIR